MLTYLLDGRLHYPKTSLELVAKRKIPRECHVLGCYAVALVTSQKTAFSIVTTVKTSDLAQNYSCS
jgi:hypothetical protein